MKTLQEKIAVMQAAAAGETIEIWDRVEWIPCPAPRWDWVTADYRVKPTPTKVYFITHHGIPDLTSACFFKPTCDTRDITAGYNVAEFVEVPK